jgi:hypothetical protein
LRPDIVITLCERCAGQVKIIVEAPNRCIEERVSQRRTDGLIERILVHLHDKAPSTDTDMLPWDR